MADNDSLTNGAVNGDTPEFFDTDYPSKKPTSNNDNADIERLNQRIADLEAENSKSESRVSEVKAELENLKLEKAAESDRAESAERAAEAIAKRASELEGEVARLQHDLITAMNDGEEARREIQALNAKIDSLRKEKSEVDDSVGKLEVLLKESESKVKAMEEKMDELVARSADSDSVVRGLMERIAEREAEIERGNDEDDDAVGGGGERGGLDGLKKQLPVIGAVSAGAIVAAMVVCYVRHSKN